MMINDDVERYDDDDDPMISDVESSSGSDAGTYLDVVQR
jgi:hypothetical protein